MNPQPLRSKKPLMTIHDIAERLSMTEAAVRARIRRGRIPGVLRDGRTYRVDPEVIEAWIESKRLNTPADEELRKIPHRHPPASPDAHPSDGENSNKEP